MRRSKRQQRCVPTASVRFPVVESVERRSTEDDVEGASALEISPR